MSGSPCGKNSITPSLAAITAMRRSARAGPRADPAGAGRLGDVPQRVAARASAPLHQGLRHGIDGGAARALAPFSWCWTRLVISPTFGMTESSEALTLLATAGRKRGFGAMFATQRLSQISKDVLGQCPNRIIGRVDQGLDRRAAADTLGFAPSGAEARALMQLAYQFWIVGPAGCGAPADPVRTNCHNPPAARAS